MRKREVRGTEVARVPVAAEAKVGVRRVGRHYLPGVHQVLGVEYGLHLPERLDDPLAEHHSQQLTSALTVAVLARERPSVARDELGGLVKEAAVLVGSLRCVEVERDPGVDAAVTEMTVERWRRIV